jgi:hypothetical protein
VMGVWLLFLRGNTASKTQKAEYKSRANKAN